MASWAPSDLLGAITRVGRWSCSTTCATVNVFPVPVAPSSVLYRAPPATAAHSSAMALGWSPAGLNSELILKGGMTAAV